MGCLVPACRWAPDWSAAKPCPKAFCRPPQERPPNAFVDLLPSQRNDDGTNDRPDHAAGPQCEAVAGDKARQKTSDERTADASEERNPPIDLTRVAT